MTDTDAPPAEREGAAAEKTFLIADVRGYTRFTREHGDAAAARLAQVFAGLAHDAVEARTGRVIELRGDEALAVFSSPAAAVHAAGDLVAACREESVIDPDLPLVIGIGIDVGEAVPVEDGFRGAALNMAARLCSQADSGQVLVTEAVAARTGRDVEGAHYRSLGTAELKGFDAPVELLEVVIAGRAPTYRHATDHGRADRTMPPELETDTPFVGRRHEVSWLRGTWRQARRGYGRVVFLTGRSQSGKTRLAAELAAYALAQGSAVSYVGASGAGTALAIAAVDDATNRTGGSAVLVLDDLDALGESVAVRIDESYEDIEAAPLLIVGIARDPAALPALAALTDRADPLGDGVRTLRPLASDELRDLARLYAGGDLDEVPLESIGRASGGMPGRAHELMSEWAEGEATRRLAASAEWLAAERVNRKANLEFANNVIGLKLARLYAADDADRGDAGNVCPYKGLASFEETDARLFFGREHLVGELAARIAAEGLLAIVGASGSGKSSLIAAGLVPSLAAGLLPGSDCWRVTVMRPGDHPMAELDRADGTLDGLSRHILVVDQFEEVFTTCPDEQERAAFIGSLTERALRKPSDCGVVLSLRGDYIDHCAPYAGLADLISANQVLVGPMSDEELRRSMELPARRVGLRVEHALVDTLVAEVADEPAGLPLLSTALVELWQHRSDGWLRMATYEQTGGVRGSVARLAESAYEQLDAGERVAARKILLRLVGAGEGEHVTRRRALLDEFDLDRDPEAAAVMSRLTEDRLLTRSNGTVEVAHEALLREWPRFQEWLNEDAQGRELRLHLAQAVRQWDDRGRDDADLYRGARLSAVDEWASTHAPELNQLEREFLAASRRAGNRAVRRLRVGIGVLVVLLVAAVVAGALAYVQRGQARHSARVALADSLGSQAVANPHLDRAMLLGVEGVDLDPSERTQGDLLTAVLRAPSAFRMYHGGVRINGLAVSPDDRTLALEDNTGKISFQATATGRRVALARSISRGPSALAFAPDGSLVRFDGKRRGLDEVDFIDPLSGSVVRRLALPRSVLSKVPPEQFNGLGPTGPSPGANNFAFWQNGHRLAVAVAGYIVKWMLPQGRLDGAPIHAPGASFVFSTAGGRRFVTVGDDRTSILDGRTGRVVRSYKTGGGFAELSPDGRTVVLGDDSGSVRFLDLGTGNVSESSAAHEGGVEAVGFTPDGKTVVTSGDDNKSRVWDVASHQLVQTLAGHAGQIHAQAISPDGSTLYTGSFDDTALAWDLSRTQGFERSWRAANSIVDYGAWNVALSPDGRTLAVGATDGTVNLWDTRSSRRIGSFQAVPGLVAAVSFGAGGRSLLVAGDTTGPTPHGYLRIWNLRPRPRLIRELHGLSKYTWATFSPDESVVAATGPRNQRPGLPNAERGDGLVAEWNAATGKLLARPTTLRGGGEAVNVGFGAHGTTVAVAQIGKWAAVVDPARRKVLAHWKASSALTLGAALSPDGKRVATEDLDGYLQLRDASTGRRLLPPIRAVEVGAQSVNWSPDGSRLVVAGNDGTIRLYDSSRGQEIGTPLPVSGAVWPYATFSHDGRTIVATDASGQVWLMPATAAGWAAYACRLANRNLSRTEWSQFVHGHSYRAVCSGRGGR